MRRFLRLTSTLAMAALLGLAAGQDARAQQTGTISGRVVDGANLQPIASAQVFIPALNTGALTREDGRFILVNIPAGAHAVSAQVIGYRTGSAQVTVAAGQTATADFQMQQDALALDEIIVTGTPGGTQRRAIGNVVSRVDAEAVTEKAPVANMQEMMSGRTPGLDFTRSTGNVGTGSAIRIRGVSSLSLGTQPLIYVDGIRVDNSSTLGPVVNRGAGGSALDDINPDDIASIEVIKGPAAATLYGTEASAGVIQIITKKGQSGAPQFTLSVNQGTSFMADPAGKIGEQWGKNPTTGELFSFNIYDHEKAAGREPFKNGYNQGYSLGVRGGTDAVRYYLSADWDDQQGIVDYNWSERMSMRANIGVLISETLNLDVSTGYVAGETSYMHGVVGGGVWDQLMWAQGHLLETPRRGYLENTPEEFAQISATRDFSRFTGSATMTHTPFEWLTQRLIVGVDRGTDENQILYPRDAAGKDGPFRNLSLGDIDVTRPINTETTFDWSASAKYGLGPAMQWTSSVGAQYYATEENTLTSHGSVFASPAIRSIEGATSKTVGQKFIQNKSLGFFVQQELNYGDRVYLTGAVRMDDNSAFGSEFDAAIYPKVSAAWVVSEEAFFPQQDWVNSLRLRSAWGKAGRQPSTFAAVTLYAPAVGPGGAAAVTPSTFGNPDVGPEVSTELEVGFEAALLNDRVTTDFTYFYQQVRDALAPVPLAPSDGFPGNQDANLGQLNNWGWELITNARLVQLEDWAIDLGFTGSHSKNEIIDLGGIAQTHERREGFPYPIYATDRILSAEFDEFHRPINVMCDGGTGLQGREPGGEPVPCAQTAAYELVMGTTYPQYKWSFTPSVTFMQNLEVFALVDGEFGRWGSETNVYCRHTPCYSNAKKALERNDPVYEDAVVSYNSHPNDRTQYGIYDADFWKLREVGARYQVPSRWIEGTGIGSAALSLSGRNIGMIWQKTKEISGVRIPDIELTSVDGGSALMQVPGLTSFTASVRVTF